MCWRCRRCAPRVTCRHDSSATIATVSTWFLCLIDSEQGAAGAALVFGAHHGYRGDVLGLLWGRRDELEAWDD